MTDYKPVKGTHIRTGDDAALMQRIIRSSEDIAANFGCQPIRLPSLDSAPFYTEKLAPDLRMYEFADRKGRPLCLRPECTNTISAIADAFPADTLVYYAERCWRYDKPQEGRYREFTQFGVEWLNPTSCDGEVEYEISLLAIQMLSAFLDRFDFELNLNVNRGSAYYKDARGFEITCDLLGAQKQIVGGGRYKNGMGFAFGVERVMLAHKRSAECEGTKDD
ncbi:MAG: ATP phosphoribosyltransferase regulatory subunit [Pseudomonadales bacterium]|nr:ATP phosphoribosyltransferase regulatory subunit [Pseudomonadales bacterium]MBL4864817.1 ATP phosphoribosyltransferase regulatory subunit [Pseudomonadales bacterium]